MTEVEYLISVGYRRTSWKHRNISRIDRADWVEVLTKHCRAAPADFFPRDNDGVVSDNKPSGLWCDYYRRVLSKDNREVSAEDIGKFPGSGHDDCGFVEIPTYE